jgi:hypothetical protein
MERTTPADGDGRSSSNRRRFLKGLGALSVVGLAGCGGDDGEDTPTGTDTDPETDTDTDPETGTDTGPETGTDTDPETDTDTDSGGNGGGETPTETDTPTETGTPVFSDNPAPLISLSDSSQIAPGGTTTVSGTIENPYLFAVTNGEFTLEAPDGEWSVSAVTGTSFGSLDSQGQQTVEWEVTAPESASGTFDLSVTGTYNGPGGTDTAEVSATLSLVVSTPGVAPLGIDCGGSHTDETVTIDGLPFRPDAETSQGIEINCENRTLTEEEIWWGENLTITPNPNAYSDSCAFEEIANTENDTLYHTEHWAEDQLEYVFDIENGTYDVTLHFAEIGGDNERIFEVSMQGETVFETGGTLASLAGGTNTAYVETIEDVEVTGNQLTIEAVSSQENPKFSGIAIREA